MVWKHLKKPAILAASLALTIGIAPMAAFADEAAPEGAYGGDQAVPELTAQDALTEVESINLNITAPIAGESSVNPPQASTTDVGYTILNEKNHWINPDTGEKLDTTFVEGESYDAMIWLTLKNGYAIAGGNIRNIPVNIENGEFKSIDGDGYDAEIGDIIEVWAKVKAAASPEPTPTTPDEPAATEPDSTEPAATDPAPAAAEDEAAATEAATSTDTATQATTSSANTTASTLPKTADALPVALFGGIALMSALVLVMAWRLRRN